MEMIDKKQFLENFQYFDNEVILEIINIFINEYPDRMETLKKNIAEKDFDQLKFNAHSLKGVVANFVAPEVQELARQLEMKGAQKELEGAEALFNELHEKADIMLEELQELKKNFA
jgi:HPt (histidine-containing phosphotransfer) domain-containing protein